MKNKEIVTWLGFLVTAYGLFPYGMESYLSFAILIIGLTMVFGGTTGTL